MNHLDCGHACAELRSELQRATQRAAAKLAGLYAVLGISWIVITDGALNALQLDPAITASVQTVKGGVYIAITAIVAYIGIRRHGKRLRKAHEYLEQANAELEQRVHERTASLQQTNAELEAFSAAVAHDLRTPLNGIIGLAQLLRIQHSADFEPRVKHSVAQIEACAARMNALIQDLLALSRVTRHSLHLEHVDVSTMAQSLFAEMCQADPDRKVEVLVLPGIHVYADAGMLRPLLDNLLSNAWKFTSRTRRARIEVGALNGENADGFYVRDNGAGFDMRSATRLFEPFVRLHRNDEFSGIGLGLVTCRRIMIRHGGHIDAQSAPGQGARFQALFPRQVPTA